MADEAFALSPISARAALPSEEDYDAISQAFMETSRGRWFLGEYAKRNRNADTRMVLDAVARIEESLAAQKQPAPDKRAGRGAGRDPHARSMRPEAAASAALDGLALEENLAPVRKGARIIREISLAVARNRRRQPDLRSARFAGRRHRSRLRTNRVGRSPGRIERRVRSDQASGSRSLATATARAPHRPLEASRLALRPSPRPRRMRRLPRRRATMPVQGDARPVAATLARRTMAVAAAVEAAEALDAEPRKRPKPMTTRCSTDRARNGRARSFRCRRRLRCRAPTKFMSRRSPPADPIVVAAEA